MWLLGLASQLHTSVQVVNNKFIDGCGTSGMLSFIITIVLTAACGCHVPNTHLIYVVAKL